MTLRPWIPLLLTALSALSALVGPSQAATLSYLSLSTRAQVGSSIDSDGVDTPWGPGLVGEVRSSSAAAGRIADESVFAKAGGFVRLPGGGRADLLIDTHNNATALGGGLMQISGQVTGTPGEVGLFRLFGNFAFAVSQLEPDDPTLDGINVGLADVQQRSTLELSGAGQSACAASRCRTTDLLRYRFEGRSGPTGAGETMARAYLLELPVAVGDHFTIYFTFAADLGYGYGAAMGNIGSLAPAAAERRGAAMDGLMLAAAELATVYEPGIGGVFLSDGLGLSADSGLVFNDGFWGLPGAVGPGGPSTPVPEPTSAALLGLALLLMGAKRKGGAEILRVSRRAV